ncbi:hypothetical protein HYQ46_007587 [Verticillium longisporum]|nr:hypothetical protein HYQ46_007587 [Verticillium longisporum]
MSRLVLARMKTLEESFADVARELRGLKTNSNSTAPPTRHNSSGEDISKASRSSIADAAGRDRRKGPDEARPKILKRTTTATKRPGSRKSMMEPRVGMTKSKNKGKEVAQSSDSDDGRAGDRGNSLRRFGQDPSVKTSEMWSQAALVADLHCFSEHVANERASTMVS